MAAAAKKTVARYRLMNIGRAKFCGDVDARSPEALLREVVKHLVSQSVAITSGGAVFAGFHEVGKVEPLDDIARAWLAKWSQ